MLCDSNKIYLSPTVVFESSNRISESQNLFANWEENVSRDPLEYMQRRNGGNNPIQASRRRFLWEECLKNSQCKRMEKASGSQLRHDMPYTAC